jgi:hypothetical protein
MRGLPAVDVFAPSLDELCVLLGCHAEETIDLQEVFAPNVPVPMPDIGRFLNDFAARTLAGVPGPGRPLFLKMPYCGPRAMQELVAYDPHLVPGILGGSAGTTHDAFRLVQDARRHGARAALFGRKINRAEHQVTFVR